MQGFKKDRKNPPDVQKGQEKSSWCSKRTRKILLVPQKDRKNPPDAPKGQEKAPPGLLLVLGVTQSRDF